MKKIRILITTPNFITAGSGWVILNILKHLDRRYLDPIVCVLKRGGLDREVEKLGIPVIQSPFTVPAMPRRTLFWRSWQAAQPFRRLEISVWQSWHYLDDYTEPLIARLAGVAKWGYTKKNLFWGSNAWMIRSLMATYIIADNPQMLQSMFSPSWLRRKVRVIPHGIDTGKFRPRKSYPNPLRVRFSITDQESIVGCVANLVPVKDHPTLIRAAALADTRPHLVLIGRSEVGYITRLQELVEDLDMVDKTHFLGSVPNESLPELLTAMDVFVLPSRSEALGVSLLEAMACERPCVSTYCGGAETVIDDRQDGFLVPVGDANAMSERIDLLGKSLELRKKLGKAARRKVLNKFDARREAEEYSSFYLELAGLKNMV